MTITFWLPEVIALGIIGTNAWIMALNMRTRKELSQAQEEFAVQSTVAYGRIAKQHEALEMQLQAVRLRVANIQTEGIDEGVIDALMASQETKH